MTFEVYTKFEELRDKRLPVALRKIELLGNLGRPSYGSSEVERREVVDKLGKAVSALRSAYKLSEPVTVTERPRGALHDEHDLPGPSGVPSGTAEGGATFEAEVRWALDAIRRGDYDLAEDRLRRCLSVQA